MPRAATDCLGSVCDVLTDVSTRPKLLEYFYGNIEPLEALLCQVAENKAVLHSSVHTPQLPDEQTRTVFGASL